jgi:phosphate transport system substrate-binding protein
MRPDARCPKRVPKSLCWFCVLGLLAGFAAAACSGGGGGGEGAPQAVPQPARQADLVILRGAGATFPAILYKEWFAVYQKAHPGTSVSYEAVGSGEGVRRFIGRNVKDEERVDFGASDAAMTDAEAAAVDRGALLLPATAGGVVLAYNIPGFEGELKLSRDAYARIFLGEIKTWNDPGIARTNPGVRLPRLTIATVVRQDKSGTTFAFTNHLRAISAKWRDRYGAATYVDWPGNAMRAAGNEGVAGRIGHSAGAIGYVGYEFAHRLGLKIAVLENREGRFVKPDAGGFAAALATADMPENLRVFIPDPAGENAYPIVTFTWVLLYKKYDAAKGPAIQDLFRWCLGEGQRYAPQKGYLPLTSEAAAKGIAALDKVSQ